MEETFITLLEDLVSIASPSLHEEKASAHLSQWLAEHGFRAKVDEAGKRRGD